MSRIRTIKPEWSINERLNRCGDSARVLSVVLITLADDHGNGRARVGYLTGQAWSTELEDNAAAAIEKCQAALDQLAEVGFVALYDVDGQRYFHIVGWLDHQKISKPGKEKVPPPSAAESSAISRTSEPGKIPEKNPGSSEKNPQDQDQDQDQEGDPEHEGTPEKVSGRPGRGSRSSLGNLPDPLEEFESVSSEAWVIRAWTRCGLNLGMAVTPTQWRGKDRQHLEELERWGLLTAEQVAKERSEPIERAFVRAVVHVIKAYREQYEERRDARADGRTREREIPFRPGWLMSNIGTFSTGLIEARRAS